MIFTQNRSVDLNCKAKNPFGKYKSRFTKAFKYGLTILGGIGFLLLLIIPNVDFSGSWYFSRYPSSTLSDVNSDKPLQSVNSGTVKDEYNNKVLNRTECYYDAKFCRLNCMGHVLTVSYYSNQCGHKLVLNLFNTTFLNGKWNATVLDSRNELQHMSLVQTNLNALDNNSFSTKPYKNLESLYLVHNLLTEIKAEAFENLMQIKNLTIIQNGITYTDSFLKAMNATLNRVKICLESKYGEPLYPQLWFAKDTIYTQLKHVDLSGNNFNNTLNKDSFAMLTAVKFLVLKRCKISYMTPDTFQSVEDTLRGLDLSRNLLTVVTGLEEAKFKHSPLSVDFVYNLWDCSCSNKALMHTLKRKDLLLVNPVYCVTPATKQNLTVLEASNKCTVSARTLGSQELLQLQCAQPASVNNMKSPVVENENFRFFMKQERCGSVNISVLGNMQESSLYYFGKPFYPYEKSLEDNPDRSNNTLSLITNIDRKLKRITSELRDYTYEIKLDEQIQVTGIYMEVCGLAPFINYLFCIIPNGESYISPFNCQAFREGRIKPIHVCAWLRNRDKYWVYSTVFVTLTLTFSIPFVLVCLYYRPKAEEGIYNPISSEGKRSP